MGSSQEDYMNIFFAHTTREGGTGYFVYSHCRLWQSWQCCGISFVSGEA